MSIRIEWAAEDHCAVDLGAMALPARGEVCLSKGLRLRISSKGLTVCGGSHSEIQMPLQASPSGPDLAAILVYRFNKTCTDYSIRGAGERKPICRYR